LPVAAIFQARTVKQLVALLRERGSSLPTSPLAPIQPNGVHPPLFLCEGVAIYYPLSRHLGGEQPVYGLATELAQDYPRVEDLAADYVAAVRTVQPEGPYFLGGLSLGGLVAFEMAQQLCASGQEVALLALFDTPVPGANPPKPFPRKWAGHLSNLSRFGFPYLRKKVGRRLRDIRRILRERWGSPDHSASRLLSERSHLRHLFGERAATYGVRAYPDRVTLFGLARRDGMSDSLFDPALVDIAPDLGWGRIATGGVEVHELPGDHVSILAEPHVRVLGEELRDCLERARGARSS
jgi:thioesterase domain-containing protein